MAEQRLTEIREIRLGKVEKLREMGVDPYPASLAFERGTVENARVSEGEIAAVAGRIMGMRGHGNVYFCDLKDETGTIQIFFQKNNLENGFAVVRLLDIGDFVLVRGKVFKTEAGEVTVDVTGFQFLGKAIRPLPGSWHGLKEVEERYRKRYLDLLLNDAVRKRFDVRTKLTREIRRYLDSLGFMEVETPTLQALYGGANAKPFKTHLNALDKEMYLRIADELYLKRLIVGGYERIYEICKDFRNEGMDLTHNPEFTMIEYYETYANYHRVMDVTEGLFKHLAKTVLGGTKMQVGESEVNIDFDWPRVKMVEVIRTSIGYDVEGESVKEMVKYCKERGVETLEGETWGQLVYRIFEHLVTDKLIEPIWVIDYPRDVSPLSKAHVTNSDWVQRFEGYIGGKEICDGWSELTDPMEQRERFESDVKSARKDREEAQRVDEDFIEAMEYGMPPVGGIGIGIDRLVMFFTNTWSIKEVILYPLMRPKERKKKAKK